MTPEQARRAAAMMDGIIPLPHSTRTIVRFRWLTHAHLTWRVERFTEGTVYRVWIGWLLIIVRQPRARV